MQAAEKMSRAATQIILHNPFWACLLLRLKIEPFPKNFFDGGPASILPKTMATDGRHIYYDDDFVESLTSRQIQGVLAHEVAHCFLLHHIRRQGRHPIGWNIAADLAINPLLKECGFDLPADCLFDDQYKNMSTEQIYNKLAKQAGSGGKGKGKGGFEYGPGSVGQFMDGGETESERSEQEQEWQGAAEQAAKAAKQAGKLPGSLERLVAEVRAPKVDWITTLRRFIENTVAQDYKWWPPNPRYVASGLYLPSVHRENLGTIVVAVDTSGSIQDNQLQQFAGELNSIANETHPEKIHVVYCDTHVQRHEEFSMGEEVTLAAKGGGGTLFKPVFDWVEKEGIVPKCLIYCSDLEGPFDGIETPAYPVLWVTDGEHIAPLGETLTINIDT